MKRYYISQIVGTGTPENFFRPAIYDVIDPATGIRAFIVNWVMATYPQGHPQFGQLVYPWCLCIVSGRKHGLVEGNPDIDPLPDFGLAVRISAMEAPTKALMFNKLTARDIDVSQFSDADGYGTVIQALGRLHAETFAKENFDVIE